MREIELVKNQSVVESNTNKNGMKLNTSRSHGILAGFFDFFFIVLAIGAILGLLTTIIGKTFFDSAIKSTLSALIIYIFAISSIVIY